jgi:p-hydroxybenzoate 3-monooxygenase
LLPGPRTPTLGFMTKETKRTVPSHEETTVAIIGGGVASLTLAIFLQRSGIACVVLERRNRAYIEARQRASFIDWDAVAMYERWGLADKLPEGPAAPVV